MSDSDEYDKISDFEGDEGMNKSAGNLATATENNNEVVQEDGNESNESDSSYVYYNDDEKSSSPPSVDDPAHDQSDKSPAQTTNQKMKDLSIDDSVKVVEKQAKADTKTLEASKKAVKPVSNDFLRFLEEDRKYELDTKLHEHITSLCFEAQRVAANEYEKCANSFGAKRSKFEYSKATTANVSSTNNSKKIEKAIIQEKPEIVADRQNPEAKSDTYHKMFLLEQKYINLQIQLAESNDPTEKQLIEAQCNEAELQWQNSKKEYDRFCDKHKATDEEMDTNPSNEAIRSAAAEQHNDIVTEKFYDAVDKHPENVTVSSPSMPLNSRSFELDQKVQKAKSSMQALAKNYSSLKLQMYQQKDKNKKAKYSKFCSQAEERWKAAKKEYEKLCKKANEIDSIDSTVAEYQQLKHQLHEVKKQIKDTKKALKSDSKMSKSKPAAPLELVEKSDVIMTPLEKPVLPPMIPSDVFSPVPPAPLNPIAATVSPNKSDYNILLNAYNVTQDFKKHLQELCEKVNDVTENSTPEFKKYFTNLISNATNEFNKASKVYQDLLDKNGVSFETQQSEKTKTIPKTYYCKKCGNYLTKEKQIISTKFSGATGPAILFSAVENVEHGEVDERNMMTGKHFVKDVNCNICHQKLGWYYETAVEETQKYKEGATVLEKALLQERPITVNKPTTPNYAQIQTQIGMVLFPYLANPTLIETQSEQLNKSCIKFLVNPEVDNIPESYKSSTAASAENMVQLLKNSEIGRKIVSQLNEAVKAAFQIHVNAATSDESTKKLNELYQKLAGNQAQPLQKQANSTNLKSDKDVNMEVDNVPGSSKSLMKAKDPTGEAKEAVTAFFKTSETGQKILAQLTDTVTAAFQQKVNVQIPDECVLKLNELYHQLNDQSLAKSSKKEQAILEDNKVENGLLRKRESMDVDDMEQKRFKDSSEESNHLSDNDAN